MSKTQAEIDALKLSWREDTTWDIEETEGFEDHRAELAAFRQDIEAARDKAERNAHLAAIDKLLAPAWTDASARPMFEDGIPAATAFALRLAAEMLLPLQRQIDRQAEDIEAMQRRHEGELDALRRQIGGR